MNTIWLRYSKESDRFYLYLTKPKKVSKFSGAKIVMGTEAASLVFGEINKEKAEEEPVEVYLLRRDEFKNAEVPSNEKARKAFLSGALYMIENSEK